MENKIHQINCPLCDSENSTFFAEKRGFRLYKCLKCKLLFIYPHLTQSPSVYDKSYFTGAEKGFGYVDYDTDKSAMIPTFQKYMDIINFLGISSGRLLDVGAATGFFMGLAEKRGFETIGVEISDFAAKIGRAKGHNIITGKIFDPEFPDGYFDVVTMFDVLEHVIQPKAVLSEVHRILKKKGLLVINTPDAESLWAKAFGVHWQLIMPPEHINYFSPRNLSMYLEKSGFKVEVSTKIGKKFTLQYIMKMLYKWQGFRIFLLPVFSNWPFSKIYLPINLRDNFFMVVRKE